MSVRNVFICSITFLILLGVWQFIWLFLTVKAYEFFKEENETFFDFCCRQYDSWLWRIRRKMNISWFYNSQAFRIFTILKGLLLVLLACVMLFILISIGFTDYNVWLDIEL